MMERYKPNPKIEALLALVDEGEPKPAGPTEFIIRQEVEPQPFFLSIDKPRKSKRINKRMRGLPK